MNWRATVILAAFVAIAALAVWRGGAADHEFGATAGNPAAPPAPAITTGPLLLAIERAQVEAVVLTSGAKRAEARREQGRWRDEKQGRIIEALLDDLSGLRTLDELRVSTGDLAQYGLQPPQGTLEIQLRDGDPVILRIGEHNPSANAVYMRFGDSGPVYLAGALLAWKLETSLTQLTAAGTNL